MTNETNTIDTAAAEAHEAANVAAWRQVEAELELEIDDATQWATIRRDGRPVATAQRRRVYDRTSPAWQVFSLDGVRIFSLMIGGRDPATRIKRRLAAHLVDQAPPALEHPTWEAAAVALRSAGFRMGQDAARRDLWRRPGDGMAARIQFQTESDWRLELFASEAAAIQARIAELVHHKRQLLDQRGQTAGHGRRARIQETIDATTAELEQLAG